MDKVRLPHGELWAVCNDECMTLGIEQLASVRMSFDEAKIFMTAFREMLMSPGKSRMFSFREHSETLGSVQIVRSNKKVSAIYFSRENGIDLASASIIRTSTGPVAIIFAMMDGPFNNEHVILWNFPEIIGFVDSFLKIIEQYVS